MEANGDHPKENEERLLTEFAVAAEPCVCRDSMANRGPGNKERLQVCSELAWRVWSQAIWKRASFALGLGNIFILLGLELKLLLFSSVMSDSAIPWTTACQVSLAYTSSQSLFKLLSLESMMASNHLILCHSLLLLPSIFPSIRVFSNESALHISWTNFSLSISSSSEYSGLISFRIDWFYLPCSPRDTQKSKSIHSSKA